MNNPELYYISNSLQKRDARQCLEDYAKEIKWNKYGDIVIDIGCGDGSVTSSVLKTFIPNNCKKLVGCDISENMVQFANDHHASDFIRFMVLDIEGDLPDQLREQFNHAFSFYALNWIRHQEIAFSNIYNLLVRGGDCLLMFMGHTPVYEIWRELARAPRWNLLLKDVNHFVSPYQDYQDPKNDIKIMMTTIGFTNVEVKYLQKLFVYTGVDDFKNAMKGVNPFKIPLEMQEDFLDDHVKVVRDMKLVDHTDNNAEDIFKDPEKDIKTMMTTIGFTNVEVKCLQKVFVYTGVEEYKNAMNGVNPFKIPLEMREDFLDDHVKLVHDMKLVYHSDNKADDTFKLKMIYKHVIVRGKK